MGRLTYSAIASLDVAVADEHGRFDRSVPSDEVQAFVNDRTRGARTRIERRFDPDAVRALKAAGVCLIGGPRLAGQALAAGPVDEPELFLSPEIVGAGTPALPDGVRRGLELVDERRFANGVVHLRHRVQS